VESLLAEASRSAEADLLKLLDNSACVGPMFQGKGRYRLGDRLNSSMQVHIPDEVKDAFLYHVTAWKAQDRATNSNVIVKVLRDVHCT
jgi:hypothetical protein